jgi:hypothetical protein
VKGDKEKLKIHTSKHQEPDSKKLKKKEKGGTQEQKLKKYIYTSVLCVYYIICKKISKENRRINQDVVCKQPLFLGLQNWVFFNYKVCSLRVLLFM